MTGYLEQWPTPNAPLPLPVGGHGRDACDPCAARQGKEHGFHLIVRVLRQRYSLDSS